jgi:hypothetical protein
VQKRIFTDPTFWNDCWALQDGPLVELGSAGEPETFEGKLIGITGTMKYEPASISSGVEAMPIRTNLLVFHVQTVRILEPDTGIQPTRFSPGLLANGFELPPMLKQREDPPR